MTTLDQKQSVAEVTRFVEALVLPEHVALKGLEGEPLNLLPPSFDAAKSQTVAVGSQLAGFTADVDPALRSGIANTFLLAQLAANRHIADHGGSSADWYDKYLSVMKNIGWVMEGNASSTKTVEGSNLEVHKEIIPIIAAALGPAAAAASTVIAVLNGLAKMQEGTPWITLFHRESQRVSANQFQVSLAFSENGRVCVTLVGFELNAAQEVTQVLFFKFSSSEATLKHFELKFYLDMGVFIGVKDRIATRLIDYVSDYISDIPI